jgi:bacterioferritin
LKQGDPSPAGLTDVQTLRDRARRQIADGAVTAGYQADREIVLKLLNEALATELVCVLRYRRHHFMARGITSRSIADEFMVHSTEEQGHADQIAERIVQLGGEPDFSPQDLAARSHAEYVAGASLEDMIAEDLVAERIAIDSYRGMIQYFGDRDPTSRRLMEEILAKEEEHADELADLVQGSGT